MIHPELCLDANIFVAGIDAKEKDHAVSLEILKYAESHSLLYFEPALVLYEFSSVLHKKRMAGELSDEECEKGIDLFSHCHLIFQWKDPIIKMGIESAKTLGLHRTYDLAYLAVAEYRDIPLITLDDQLRKRGREIFKKVFTPEEFLASVS